MTITELQQCFNKWDNKEELTEEEKKIINDLIEDEML